MIRRSCHDLLTGRGGPSQADNADFGVLRQIIPNDGPATTHKVGYPCRQTDFINQFCKCQRQSWGVRTWFDHDGIAGYQSWPHFPSNQEEREVPSNNTNRNTDWLTGNDNIFVFIVRLHHIAGINACGVGHIVKIIRRKLNFGFR